MPASEAERYAGRFGQDVKARETPNQDNTLSLHSKVRIEFSNDLTARSRFVTKLKALLQIQNLGTWREVIDQRIEDADNLKKKLEIYFTWSGVNPLISPTPDLSRPLRPFINSFFKYALIELAAWRRVEGYLISIKKKMKPLSPTAIPNDELNSEIELLNDALRIIEGCWTDEATSIQHSISMPWAELSVV